MSKRPSPEVFEAVNDALTTVQPDEEFTYEGLASLTDFHATTVGRVLNEYADQGKITRVKRGSYKNAPCTPTQPVVKDAKKLTLEVLKTVAGKTFATDASGQLYIVTKVNV